MILLRITFGLAVLALAGCKGNRDFEQAPVEECVAYEKMLKECFGKDVGLARQPMFTPKNDRDVERIRALCESSMKQLRGTCGVGGAAAPAPPAPP